MGAEVAPHLSTLRMRVLGPRAMLSADMGDLSLCPRVAKVFVATQVLLHALP